MDNRELLEELRLIRGQGASEGDSDMVKDLMKKWVWNSCAERRSD